MPTNDTYRTVLNLKVPTSNRWEPHNAVQIISGLYSLYQPFNLIIRATPTSIKWQIEVGQTSLVSAKNLMRSTFHRIDIEEAPKTGIDKGFYLYQCEAALPLIMNLKHVSDCQQDPLNVLVGNLQGLEFGEEVVYELVCGPTQLDYVDMGEKMLVTNVNKWYDYAMDGSRNEALARQLSGTDQVQKFNDAIDSSARKKIQGSLCEVNFLIKVKAANHDKVTDIAQRLTYALSSFDSYVNAIIPGSSDTFPLVLTAEEVACLWHLPSQDIKTPGIEWASGLYAPIPVTFISTGNKPSIVLGTSKYQDKDYPVKLPYEDRVTHINIVGMTRVGKSTFIHNLVHQDIANGQGVAVLDPHGDLVNDILQYSIPENRIDDVVLVDVGDKEFPVGLNLLAPQTGISEEDAAGNVLSVIRKMFAAQWSATQMEDVMYSTIVSLMSYPNATLMDIPRFLTNPSFRTQVLRNVKNNVTRGYWRDEFEPMSEGQKLLVARPINTRVRRFYRDETMQNMVGQSTSLDFRTIMDRRKILLMNIKAAPKSELETLGSLLIARIQMAAMSRSDIPVASRVPFYFYIDEVQNFITTSLAELFSEAGKFQISLSVGNQFLKQLEGDTLDAVLGNVGTNIIFRVGAPDARVLAGTVRPNVTPDDLQNLNRFQTVVKMQLTGQTQPAFSMLTAKPPKEKTNSDETIARIRDQSRQRYAKSREQVVEAIAALYGDIVDESGPGPDEPKPVSFLG